MFRQKPPGEGGLARPVQFSYVPTLAGQQWMGYLAGPIQWLECHTHRDHPSKPCLKWITSGALGCPRCTKSWNNEVLGYTPIYRETDHRECLVVLREGARDVAEGLEFPVYVCVSRESGKADSTTVSRSPRQKKWVSSLPRRTVPADLQYSLLTMWKINELTEYMRCQPGGTIVPPVKHSATDVPTESTGSVPLDCTKIAGILDARADKSRELASRESTTAAFLRRIRDGGTNGKPEDPH